MSRQDNRAHGAAPPIPSHPYEQFVRQRRAMAAEEAGESDAGPAPEPRFKGKAGGRVPFKREFGDLDTNSFETVTLETPLSENNPGFKMLLKMGWKTGTGLGSRRQGRVDPIAVSTTYHKLGLGKMEADLGKAKETTESRRLLESERLQQLDAEAAAELESKWKASAEKKEAIAKNLEEVNSVFYCETCRKQYKTVGEFDNHLSSYDHHHTKRLKELRERERKQKSGSGSQKSEKRKAARELERISQLANSRAQIPQKSEQSNELSPWTSELPHRTQPQPSVDARKRTQQLGGNSDVGSGWSTPQQPEDMSSGWSTAQQPEHTRGHGGGWSTAGSSANDPPPRPPPPTTSEAPPRPPPHTQKPSQKRVASAVASAFGGSSDEEEPAEVAPPKKHRTLWKPK